MAAPGRVVPPTLQWGWCCPGSGDPLGTCAALSVFKHRSLNKTPSSETPAASFSNGFSFQTTNCPEGRDPVLAMASQQVITVQPQFMTAPRVGEWQSGLMDCCSDCGVCEYIHTPHSWCQLTMCFWCFPRSFCSIAPAANPTLVGTSSRAAPL